MRQTLLTNEKPTSGRVRSGEGGFHRLDRNAVVRLRAEIFGGHLRPGEYLSYEQLSERLQAPMSDTRDAAYQLAQMGLIDVHDAERPRVILPNRDERGDVIQCLGALLGGVSRTTVPKLGESERCAILIQLDYLMDAVARREPYAYAEHFWGVIDALIYHCPNPYLASVTRGRVEALAFLLSLISTTPGRDWERLQNSLQALRDAVQVGDALGAELALETAFRILPSSGVRSTFDRPSGLSVDAEDDSALLELLGALLGSAVRTTISCASQRTLDAIVVAAARALQAAHGRDRELHRQRAMSLMDALLAACPNRHLVNAARGTYLLHEARLAEIWTQQSMHTDSAIEGYRHFISALRDGDAILAELSVEHACMISRTTYRVSP